MTDDTPSLTDGRWYLLRLLLSLVLLQVSVLAAERSGLYPFTTTGLVVGSLVAFVSVGSLVRWWFRRL
ncbi:hypothetical protein [Halobaculum sp. MBLA0143]|uniref:hypothetical protein n=1 Tax=Halobaculum sp. MBLA0143 TaxID=3079933 RepID=UPI003523B95B